MSKKSSQKKKKLTSMEQATNVFQKYLEDEAERTGKSVHKVAEEMFKDGFLIWSVKDTEEIAGSSSDGHQTISQTTLDSMVNSIRKNDTIPDKSKDEAIANLLSNYKVMESATAGGSVAQAPPILTAWAMPNVAEDIDELRRLRREFAPVSRAVDYIKSMILGNELDVEIQSPEDKNKKAIREDIKKWMKNIFQDEYTTSLYTLMSIMLDESLTVGAAGAEIRYENSDFKFEDYIDQVQKSTLPVAKSTSGGSGKEFVYYKSHEPEWSKLKSIPQLKLLKNASGRLKLYRNPLTWEANYWTLDEIVSTGDTAMAVHQMSLKKEGMAQRFHPWQIFWLNVNRREFDERGMSVVAPAKNIALLLEKVLNAVGEGCFRAGNRKYFIVCGTEKRPWSKPHIRNVMQQINEMGKRNWTTIPVPYGFDIKEIGGDVFQANQVITVLVNLLAQAMHVPNVVLGILLRATGTSTGDEMISASFNEIEQMRYEFKQAIESQLFKKQLWCTLGKTKNKQGGKGYEEIYVPALKCSTKGLLSPIEKLNQIIKLLNVANPVSPQMKLEVEREMADIMGYDNIDFETQEELKAELKKRVGTDTSIANPLMGKAEGQPQAQTKERAQGRLEGGVNVSKKGQSKPMGGTRIPSESKKVSEAMIQELFEYNPLQRRIELQSMHFDPKTVDAILEKEKDENQMKLMEAYSLRLQETPLTQEPSQKPQDITPTSDYKNQSSQKTGGNYGPQGYYQYYKVMEIPDISKEGDAFTIPSPIIDQQITVEIRKLADAVARYNKDLTKIYVDPALPIETYKPILSREIFEYQLEQSIGQAYDTAEKMADLYEESVCEQLDIDWTEHQKAFKKALGVVNSRKDIKNPDDVVIHTKTPRKPKANKSKSKVEELANEGRSSMRSETGDKETKTGVEPKKDIQYTHETVTHDVNIVVKTEPFRIEQGKSEIVIVETSKPEIEKALADLMVKQKETSDNLTKVSDDIKARQDALKILEEKKNQDDKEMSEKKLIAEMARINMDILRLNAEREKIEAEKRTIEETAQKKQELLKQIKDKIDGEEQ